MSMPVCIFYCSKCDFKQSYTNAGIHHVYEKNNGETITAPTCEGWCTKCNNVTLLLTGLNPEILSEEILRNEEIISNILRVNLSEYEKKAISSLVKAMNQKKEYLAILNGNVSVNYCLRCSSTDVFPMYLAPDSFSYPEITSYTHINCGGQLRIKWSDFRISFNNQEKTVIPLFIINE